MNDIKKLCVVVPYRDREAHLVKFVPSMHEALKKQNIPGIILICEQTFTKSFNRGMMKNIGAKYAIDNDFDYVCFHDIDMIPDISDYTYTEFPTHLAVEVEQFGWKLPYNSFFGGVVLISCKDLIKMNGYFNDFWGWGAEDDDFYDRCKNAGLNLHRKNGRYFSLNHERPIIQEEYTKNLNLLKQSQADSSVYQTNGLNSLKYKVIEETTKKIEGFEYKNLKIEI